MSSFNFTPFPVLETQQLSLRRMLSSDDNEIYTLRSDRRVQQYIDRPDASSIDDARKFMAMINKGIDENKWLYWAITFKGQARLIGTICLWNFSEQTNSGEVGYELLPDFHGKGLMQEALVKVLSFAFDTLNLDSIYAFVKANNYRSIRILERNGFTFNRNEEGALIYILNKKSFHQLA